MAFDENKYKAIFEKRYGAGSFDAGLSQAREIGRAKAQSSKQSSSGGSRTKAQKKTYDDALSYWNDPANKEHLLNRGVHNIENDYLNDPRAKAAVKESGFKQQDFIDAMYSVASGGSQLSKRGFKQDQKKEKDTVSEKPKKLIPIPKQVTASEKPQSLIPLKSDKKKTESKKSKGLLDDLKAVGKATEDFFNPFDKVSAKDAVNNFLNRKQSDTFKETARFSNNFLDSYTGTALSNLDKKVNNRDPYYLSKREFGEGGGTDMLARGLGYLGPGALAYKGLNAMKAGKALTQFGSKGLLPRLGSEAAKGAIVGAGLSGAEVGVREGLNPNDFNWKQNLGYIGQNAALGAIADPLLYGAGKGIQKGFVSASNNTMKSLLPKNEAVANELANAYKQYNSFSGRPNANVMNDLIPKGNDIANPSYLPKLNAPKPIDAVVPKIGKRIDELPVLKEEDISLADRLSVLNDPKRSLPDYSFGKPKSEPNPPVNVYGVEVPFDKVQHAPSDYWRSRYEEFVNTVNKNYDPNKLNKEALDDLWSQFARYDEPVSLEQAVELAYPKKEPVLNANDVWEKMGNRQPVTKAEQKILLGEPKAKSTPKLLPELNANRTPVKPAQPIETPLNSNAVQSPIKPVEAPLKTSQTPKQPNERSFFNTVQNPEKLSPELQQRLEEFDKTYKPMSNQELVDYANKYVSKDIEKAYQFVKNARKFDSRHVTVGHRLIDELQKAGQFDRALDVVERLAEQGTKAGQSIQSYSIYNRLSAEGQLLRAQRHVNRINQSITDPTKQVKLTPQHVEDITQTADSIQKFAGQMEQASNVMTIMDKVKKGKVATDSELETVRSFVSDAKKFFGDLAPNVTAPKVKPVKDVRTRDKVVDFMSKKEDVARKELQKIFGRANSMPVDAFYHLSVIGASKIAKGTVKMTDFTEEMVKDFGEMVRPYAKQIYNKAVETFNLQSESMTAKRLSEVEKITNKALKDKNLDADQADSIREFARQVGLLSGDAKLEKSMELQSVLQDLERPTFGQKLSAAQTIAQLLNPKTIVRNAIGNEMFYRVEQMNKLLATPVDIVRSKITGGERTITFRANNQGQYWRNWLTGAKAGWKGVNPMGLTTAYDIGPQAFRSKFNPLTYLEKSLGATLRSFDHAGYMRAYNKTLGELASLRAINEGLTGTTKKEAIARYIREADANMVQIADQYGKYATFQDNTALSNALTKVKKGMNKVSTLGATEEFGLGDLVLKYPKTPGNLVMRALDYSPVGIIRSATLLNDAVFKSKNPLATKAATLSFTRAIMGTGGFSLLGYFLADKGILTSSGDSDYEVASLERSAGKQPNSVNVSALKRFLQSGLNPKSAGTKEGDTFISYDWAQPISIAIALGTGVNQSVKENGELSVGGAIKGGADSAANTVINQSVLKGLNDFLANYPGRTMSDRIGDAGKGIAGSFVPTLSNQVRQVGDNTVRSTYSPKLLPEIKNRAINRVPGLQKQLPPAYDTLGNKKQTYQNGGNSLINVFLNPSFVSKYKPSSEAKFVLDVISKTGDKSLAPRIAQKKLDGEPLTSKQYAKMQRIMGEEVKRGLSGLTSTGDSERDAKTIEKILREAGKTAREAIRTERGE